INRFYVQDDVYDEFAKKLTAAVKKLEVGDGLKKTTQVGPLINPEGLEKVIHHVKDATEKGATIATGGKAIKGNFFEPTVLLDVRHDSVIAGEETFGPSGGLLRFKTEKEVIKLANGTPFG